MLQQVESTVASMATSSAAPQGAKSIARGSWKAWAASKVVPFLIGAIVGTGAGAAIVLRVKPSQTVRTIVVTRLVQSPAPQAIDAGSSPLATDASPDVTTEITVSHRGQVPAIVTAPAPPPAPVAVRGLADERELIDIARSAVARGHYREALASLGSHAREFPNGRLAEEREVLSIQALALAGRSGEARARAERFRRSFPTSILLPAVERMVGSIP